MRGLRKFMHKTFMHKTTGRSFEAQYNSLEAWKLNDINDGFLEHFNSE